MFPTTWYGTVAATPAMQKKVTGLLTSTPACSRIVLTSASTFTVPSAAKKVLEGRLILVGILPAAKASAGLVSMS